MLGRLIAIKLMRKAERRQCTIKPRINDGTIERAYDAGFVDINGNLTHKVEKLMDFLKTKSSKTN